jgi:hypothetical protein
MDASDQGSVCSFDGVERRVHVDVQHFVVVLLRQAGHTVGGSSLGLKPELGSCRFCAWMDDRWALRTGGLRWFRAIRGRRKNVLSA